jgi:hypothetical protein
MNGKHRKTNWRGRLVQPVDLEQVPASLLEQNVLYGLVAALLFGLWGIHILRGGTPVFPVDDAYITLHSAQVLHWGRDPNYVGTPALVGITSAVHMALVAVLLFFLKPVWALDTSLWIALIAYTLGIVRLAFVLRASVWQAALLVAVGLLTAKTPHQLMNGLETGLMLAALVWTLAFASDSRERGKPALPLLCGVLPFIRPELVVVSLLLLLYRGWSHWERFAARERVMQLILRDVLLVLLGAAPWVLWYWASTGHPFPSTIGAKQAFFAESCLPPSVKMGRILDSLLLFAGSVGWACVGFYLLLWTRLGRLGLLFMGAFAGAYYCRFPGALQHYEQRYLYVFLPFLLYGLASCFMARKKRLKIAATATVCLAAVQFLLLASLRWREHRGGQRFTSVELAGTAAWCNRHLPKRATILVHDAGYIAYATRFHLVDFVGLKTPSSVRFQEQETLPTCGVGRARAVHEIALRSQARYFIMLQGWDSLYGITAGMKSLGWRLEPLRQPSPPGGYTIYKMTPPQGEEYEQFHAP